MAPTAFAYPRVNAPKPSSIGGVDIPPSSRIVAYVHASYPAGAPTLDADVLTTLDEALGRCTADRGDFVVVLSGHAEDVADATMLDNLVDGVTILGEGNSSQDVGPTFNFSAAGGRWVLDNDNVSIHNLRFMPTGPVTNTGISVTGSGFTMSGCYMSAFQGASEYLYNPIDIGSGADRATIEHNRFLNGAGGGALQEGIHIAAAVRGVRIRHNSFAGRIGVNAGTPGNGWIFVSAAATALEITDNDLNNTRTDSTDVMSFSDVAATGIVARNMMNVGDDNTASTQGITIAGTTSLLVRFFENYCSDEAGKTGVLSPVVVAT